MVALAFIILRRSGGAELPQKLATGSALAGVMRSARGPSGAALLRGGAGGTGDLRPAGSRSSTRLMLFFNEEVTTLLQAS